MKPSTVSHVVGSHIYIICFPDVNECGGSLDVCAFRCLNIPGSFRCVCPMGYRVADDGIHCEGIIAYLRLINIISHLFLFGFCSYHVECIVK